MKTKTLGCLVAFAAASCSFVSCSEPATPCVVGLAGAYPYAVRYTATTTPACATAPGFTLQLGDLFGMDLYYPVSSDGTTFDDTVPASLAVRSDALGNEILTYAGYTPPGTDLNTAHTPNALGKFTSVNPDANNMCQVTGFANAEQDFTAVAAEPAGPGMMPPALPALPADSVTYAWANFSVYVTAADQGTQFSGDVTVTDNGCAVTYHAVGLWPGISCDDGMGNPVPEYCNPCANPAAGIFIGSGISPDAQVVCKPILPNDPYGRATNWCVLDTGEPPVLNPNPPTCEGGGGGGPTTTMTGAGGGGAGGGGAGGGGMGGGGTGGATTTTGTGGMGTGGMPADAGPG